MSQLKEDVQRVPTEIDKGTTELIEDGESQSAEEKALVRRVDLFLMPTLWLMYMFSYADRTNIANAKVAGMSDDLHLSSGQYSLSIVIFFIPYVIFQIPSNLIIVHTRPSLYLPAIMCLWGAVTCCMAAVKNHEGLLAVRFILGLLESSFAPGVNLLLSTWYKKSEQAKRFSIFYSASVLSGAFGSIIAGAITSSLDGAQGIAAWRWLFIIEGSATMACAIISAFVLPDFPATTRRFSDDERRLAIERLAADNVIARSEDSPPINSLRTIKDSLRNWRTWMFTLGYTAIGGSATMSYFYPTLVAGLGYTSHKAQYMVVPIYAVAFVAVLATGFFNDMVPKYRGAFVASCLALAMSCGIVVCAVYNFTARYVLLVFMASGLLAANPLSLAFASSTFGPMQPETRGVSLAFINSIANLSQIYGAYLFPSGDAPKYLMGFGVVSGLCAVAVVVYSTMQVLVRRYPIQS